MKTNFYLVNILLSNAVPKSMELLYKYIYLTFIGDIKRERVQTPTCALSFLLMLFQKQTST